MNSPKLNHFMTNARQEIDEKNRRRYSNWKEQKNIAFYNLYKAQIVTIQKWFRNCMAKKRQRMERIIREKLKQREKMIAENHYKKQQIGQIKARRSLLLREKENQMVQFHDKKIGERVTIALERTLESAERVAENNGKVKYILEEINRCQNKEQEWQGEVQALKFEYGCYKKRRVEWQQKLFKIKENILNESLKAKDLRTKLNQLSRRPQ